MQITVYPISPRRTVKTAIINKYYNFKDVQSINLSYSVYIVKNWNIITWTWTTKQHIWNKLFLCWLCSILTQWKSRSKSLWKSSIFKLSWFFIEKWYWKLPPLYLVVVGIWTRNFYLILIKSVNFTLPCVKNLIKSKV